MSALKMTNWAIGALALSLALQVASAVAGPIGIVDDFSGNLAAWTSTRILNNANHAPTNTHAWQITGGALELNTTAYVGIEQFALTRTDYNLSVGQELRGDFKAGFTGTQDIGLYVGAGTPTQDVRANYVNVYVRNNGQIFSRGFNGATEFTLGGGATPANISSLFVARTTIDTFELGYYDGIVRNLLSTRTIGSSNAAGVGSSIGAYADVRAAGIVGNLDNLRIVPEPASWLMGILGLIGAAPLCKRRVRT
jgi:hypothetical protein